MKRTHVAGLPIRVATDGKLASKVGFLASALIRLEDQGANTRSSQDKEQVRRQIGATDRQIDRLVYELYGLTDEEISVVEAATGVE